MAQLPIAKFNRELLYLIERHAVVIVVGCTGSGKTTQIPQFLLQNGWNGIVCTQPRRLSTITVATRVAQERSCRLGAEVGYCVRFEECTSGETRCRFMTDGMLFRECLHDPLLSRYSVIMIDEAHERSLHTDLLLAVLKKILKKRPDLRIIISSATIDAQSFAAFFAPKRVYGPTEAPQENAQSQAAPLMPAIISIDTPNFPVECSFLTSTEFIRDEHVVIDAVCRLVEQINAKTSSTGDILVFLAGRSEIEQCCARLEELSASDEAVDSIRFFKKKKRSDVPLEDTKRCTILPIPLFAGVDFESQVLRPAPPGKRKVILSTNVAEASITIDGVVFVIDSGRMKVRFWDAEAGFERLCCVPISKASARQRAGRAGRTCPGQVYRLYSQAFHDSCMPKESISDLQLADLTATVLQLKALGVEDVFAFDWMKAPAGDKLQAALTQLKRLGALSAPALHLTDPLGKQMAQLPLQPALARVFLHAAVELKCPKEAAALVAMLTIQHQNSVDQNCFFTGAAGRKFWVEEGDHMTLVSLFMSYLRNASRSVRFCQKFQLNLKSLTTAHRLFSTLLAYLKLFKVIDCSTSASANATCAASKQQISESLRRALFIAFPLNIARADEEKAVYYSLSQPGIGPISIHPTSVLFKRLPPLILYNELLETTKLFARFVSVVEEKEWIVQDCSQFYELK
jgi:ATP-dependent RNA helicase DDX35